MRNKPTYQHFVPRVYLKSWQNEEKNLYIRDLRSNKINMRNVNAQQYFGQNNYYTLKAGMVSLENDDLKEIYTPIRNCDVFFEGRKLKSLREINSNFCFRQKWQIYPLDSNEPFSERKKRRVFNEIQENINLKIEKAWSKEYEQRWGTFLNEIDSKITELVYKSIPFDKEKFEFLVKFFVMMDWRTEKSSNLLERAIGLLKLRKLGIPYFRELEKEIKLKNYNDFLFSKQGLLNNVVRLYLSKTHFELAIADKNKSFITSDNPVCLFQRKKEDVMGFFPISSNILILQKEGSFKQKLDIVRLTKREVDIYNVLVKENADSCLVGKKYSDLLSI